MPSFPTTALAGFLMLLSAPAWAAAPLPVPLSQFGIEAVLHAPPAPDSAQTAAELSELHRIEAARTPAELARAKADAADESVFLFQDVFGAGFTAAGLPRTAAFFARLQAEEEAQTDVAKRFWHRPRPGLADATLHPCKVSHSASYPSGHATDAYLIGVVLASVVPEKRDAILDRAAGFARNRMVCGMHYASDIEAGRLAGTALAAVILAQPRLRADLQPVRRELKAAGFAR